MPASLHNLKSIKPGSKPQSYPFSFVILLASAHLLFPSGIIPICLGILITIPSYIKKIVTCNSLWPLPQGYHIKRKSENRRGAHSRHRIATRIPGRDTRITQPRQSGQSRWRSLRLPQRRGTFLLTPNANFQRCLTCGPSNCHYQRRRFFLWHTFPTQLLSDDKATSGLKECQQVGVELVFVSVCEAVGCASVDL